MTDGDLLRDVRELERSLSAVKSDVIEAKNEATSAKHEARQAAQGNIGLNTRLDKVETRMGEHIERLSEKIDDKFEKLENKLLAKIDVSDTKMATIKLQQAKGASFWMGILFVFTTGATIASGIYALVKSALGQH